MPETLKVLVTGTSGVLGSDVAFYLKSKEIYEVIELKGRSQLNLLDSQKVVDFVGSFKPDVIIHCAGTHDIDWAEEHPIDAFLNIVLGTRNVVNAAAKFGAVLVYPGSDYIFDGFKNEPYMEHDTANPINVYGKCKLAAENIIKELLPQHFIFRLPILFGARGDPSRNIIHQTHEKLQKGQKIYAAYDQVSSCAYTYDVAMAFEQAMRTCYFGTYNFSNKGSCSRYELYREIALLLGLPQDLVEGVPSAELKRAARRPRYTVLNTINFEQTFGAKLRSWKEALSDCIRTFREGSAK
jgi:dTDP-4-dehydrorhamnose reductase